MLSGLLASSRARSACVCLAAAATIAGCGTAGSSAVTVTGKTLTVYLSAPASLQGDPQAQDVIDAELLGFNSSCTLNSCPPIHIGGFTVDLVRLTGEKISSNARRAIIDSTAVAYLGEVVPGASADSVGITNAQDLLQVSPTDTAIELTESTPAISGAPGRYYESKNSHGQTFARMVPNGSQEAKAVAAEMKSLGVSSLQVQSDGSEYGRALADAVKRAFGTSSSGNSAIFYAGTPGPAATKALDSAAASNPNVKLFASSGLDDDAFVSGLSPQAQHALYVSSPGFTSGSLSPAGQTFLTSFKSAFGHAPSSQAIFGYASMSAVVGAIRKAGSGADNRSTIVKDLLGSSSKSSVLGTVSIGNGGDITIRSVTGTTSSPFVFLRVKAGKLVLPHGSAGP
jgi:branched-chain amino acid transport system substrate-binding protein